MLLPFVREVFADVETLPAFRRAASHLREGTGRIRLSGLTPTAKALLLALLHQASRRPLLVVVPDNKAAEELSPMLRSLVELTGALDPESVVEVPGRDVLPFQNQSAHPEIQEARAAALWRIATGNASIVVAPPRHFPHLIPLIAYRPPSLSHPSRTLGARVLLGSS